MLEQVRRQRIQQKVVRFAVHREDDEFLGELDLSPQQVREMKELLGSRERTNSLQALMEAPFKPKRRLWKSGYPRTRYSDGTFPVGYFSVEAETAEAEVHYWLCSKFIGKPSEERKAWYSRFTCHFGGDAKDLQSMREVWPNLTHRSNYSFCNELGARAVADGLQGLVVPSARKLGGTNVPVFAKEALRNPRQHSFVEVKCSAPIASGEGPQARRE